MATKTKATFNGSCGEDSSAVSAVGLQPDEEVELNGNTDLSTCVRGNNNAKVYGIWLSGNSGTYDYAVNVDAEGPHGFGSGNMYIHFTDEGGDRYELKLYSSTRANHFVRYNSKKPAIVKIEWNNHTT